MQPEGLFISKTFGDAWALFKKGWLTFYMIMLLPFAISIAYSFLSSYLPEGIISGFVAIVYFVFSLVIGMGTTHMLLKFVRGEKIDVAHDLLAKKGQLLNYILGSLMYAGVIIGGLILLIIPGIYWGMKYMFVPYLIIDKGNTPSQAFKNSALMTKSVKWDILGFSLASGMLIYAGLLALVVGVIVTGAVATISYALFYERLSKRLNQVA